MWAWYDPQTGAPHLAWIVIYKGKLAVRVHCFTNQDIFVRKHFLCFVCTQPFDVNPMHGFINE